MMRTNILNQFNTKVYCLVISMLLLSVSCVTPEQQTKDIQPEPSQLQAQQAPDDTTARLQWTQPQGNTVGIAITSDPHFASKTSNSSASTNILRLCETWFQQNVIQGLIILGDYVDWGGNMKTWQEAVSIMKNTAPNLPIFGLAGNHDIYGNGLANWLTYSMKPHNIASQQTPYWEIQIQDIHFLGLYLPWGYADFNAKQKLWLQQTLSNIPDNHFIVILTHSFFYASGYYDFWSGGAWYDNRGNITHIAPLFKERADLVISGHNHYMEWIEQDGINWAIVGAMGGKPDPEPTYITQGSKFFQRNVFGLLLLQRTHEGLRCSFIDEHGATLYSTTITKQVHSNNTN
ncbi:MAG TPA: metallophosphoesterase family protein [Spirochaetales bacterium]|nr:metallophosphoesterase family protein [Spirochaetales bacterium]HQK33127.1 metallophosphoesterase family protein [Spirochaetales bacterium]